MRFTESNIQTLREAPSNARTPGLAWLVRANYLTHENEVTALGQRMLARVQQVFASGQSPEDLFRVLNLPVIKTEHNEFFFALPTGKGRVLQCPSCRYAARQELARFEKEKPPTEAQLGLEKVFTPDCPTIEALTDFLNIPARKTAKAILLTRKADDRFVFVVVRGDMQLSEAKLEQHIGDFQAATAEEISAAGAWPGYASPVSLEGALILADDLIPLCPNLVAGANQTEHHFLNVNYGRDYTAGIVADLVEARAGDACPNCDGRLELFKVSMVMEIQEAGKTVLHPREMLLAFAETHQDEHGLSLPVKAAPYEVCLIGIPGKKMDTLSAAGSLFEKIQGAGVSVLYDDRDARAGVKFNDADLLGIPIRVTVGELGLEKGNVEVKLRDSGEKEWVDLDQVVAYLLEKRQE